MGNFAIYMVYALMSSGHLPLMMPILLLGILGEGLVARVAWAEGRLEADEVRNVAAPAVKLAQLLSLVVHLASAAADTCTLVIASTYFLVLIMTRRSGTRGFPA